jgi:2-phospho-L-lactate guanylyltransferase
MVGSRDVSLVLEALAPALPGVAIAPDRHRLGTNALLLRPPGIFPTRFGEGSFAAHCEAARRTGSEPAVVETVALGLDIDEPSDLSLLPAEVFSSLMLQTKELVRGQTRT